MLARHYLSASALARRFQPFSHQILRDASNGNSAAMLLRQRSHATLCQREGVALKIQPSRGYAVGRRFGREGVLNSVKRVRGSRGSNPKRSERDRLSGLLAKLQRSVDQNREQILEINTESAATRQLWREETMSILRTQMSTLEGLIRNAFQFQVRGYNVVTPQSLAAIGMLAIAFAIYKNRIYRRVAEESAAIGKEVMEENSRNLVDTVKKVTKDPETLAAVLQLLVELLEADVTKRALINLLLETFKDEQLCRVTGTFLLDSLNTETTREQLNQQTAALLLDTVRNKEVRVEAGAAVRSALGWAVVPPGWVGSKVVQQGVAASRGNGSSNSGAQTQTVAKESTSSKTSSMQQTAATSHNASDDNIKKRDEEKNSLYQRISELEMELAEANKAKESDSKAPRKVSAEVAPKQTNKEKPSASAKKTSALLQTQTRAAPQ